jgi:hypothetical protein
MFTKLNVFHITMSCYLNHYVKQCFNNGNVVATRHYNLEFDSLGVAPWLAWHFPLHNGLRKIKLPSNKLSTKLCQSKFYMFPSSFHLYLLALRHIYNIFFMPFFEVIWRLAILLYTFWSYTLSFIIHYKVWPIEGISVFSFLNLNFSRIFVCIIGAH